MFILLSDGRGFNTDYVQTIEARRTAAGDWHACMIRLDNCVLSVINPRDAEHIRLTVERIAENDASTLAETHRTISDRQRAGTRETTAAAANDSTAAAAAAGADHNLNLEASPLPSAAPQPAPEHPP